MLAPNPGPMTLDGTNTLVIRQPGSQSIVVVDPGPLDDAHLARVRALGSIELILLTHNHLDHTQAAHALHAATTAPVRAFDSVLVRGAQPLADGDVIAAAGCEIEVVATPGHTADSACFVLHTDMARGSDRGGTILTGDTILGRGTTVIADTGSIADYLATLTRLRAMGELAVLPAHGDPRGSLVQACTDLYEHRQARLNEIRDALIAIDREPQTDAATIAAVTDAIYASVPERIRNAAERSTRAQLEYLIGMPPGEGES